jgi:kynurenine 3-monooxygenase
MIALPNLDRSYTVSLFLPNSQFDEINASGPNGVVRFFKEHFPDAVRLIGDDELVKAHPLLPSSLMTIRVGR